MRVFITGIAGFLGSHLADAMVAEGYEIVGIDSLIGGYADNVPAGIEWANADCRERDTVARLMRGSDVVYHCAALAYEGLSVFSPYTVVSSIVDASTSVFSAAVENKVKRIVYCSSMARYGIGDPPFREFYSPCPQDPYGIAKVAAENILRNLCQIHGMEFVIAVPHNIIGPRQKYDDPYRNVASIMMNRMLQGQQPIIYGDGQQQRCFSFIGDCISCLTKMATANVNGEVINIGPDEEYVTINTLAREIASIVDFPHFLVPQYVPGRPQEVRIAVCSSQKARRDLGYRTQTTLRDGLWTMAEWMRARGTRPFIYHLPIEILTPDTPRTWTERIF